jgi:RNA polymerase sigma factor (sigma-70 family)
VTDEAIERFEQIYRQHFRAVLRYALARLEPESAKDAAAETFLVAWRRLGDVPSDPRPWLFGVTRKVIAGQLRSSTRRDALRARLEQTDSASIDPGEFDKDMAERGAVLAAMASLSENDCEVLKLIAWDELPSTSAAKILGISRIAFGVRLHRARRRLAIALETVDRSPRLASAGGADPPTLGHLPPLHTKELR